MAGVESRIRLVDRAFLGRNRFGVHLDEEACVSGLTQLICSFTMRRDVNGQQVKAWHYIKFENDNESVALEQSEEKVEMPMKITSQELGELCDSAFDAQVDWWNDKYDADSPSRSGGDWLDDPVETEGGGWKEGDNPKPKMTKRKFKKLVPRLFCELLAFNPPDYDDDDDDDEKRRKMNESSDDNENKNGTTKNDPCNLNPKVFELQLRAVCRDRPDEKYVVAFECVGTMLTLLIGYCCLDQM